MRLLIIIIVNGGLGTLMFVLGVLKLVRSAKNRDDFYEYEDAKRLIGIGTLILVATYIVLLITR